MMENSGEREPIDSIITEESMKKRRRTNEERIANLEQRQAKLEEERKKLNAQMRKAKQQKSEADRKERTHKLCQIGGLVEKYLGRALTESDWERFEEFLLRCRKNGESFLNFMNGSQNRETIKEEERA